MAGVITKGVLLCKDARLGSHLKSKLQIIAALGRLAAGSQDEAVQSKLAEALLLQVPSGGIF